MSIKAIFYDFDGVIKESTQIKTQAFREMYLPYGNEIANAVVKHHLANGGISRFEKFRHYHSTLLNKEITQTEVDQLAARFSDIVMQKVIECPYVQGAYESLQALHSHYEQYIVTGTPQVEIEEIVHVLGIQSFFEGVFGSPKDKIEISEYILSLTSLAPHEILFIGDAMTDYKAAKHFNFAFVLREHEENALLFREEKVIKSKDLTQLDQILKSL